MPIARDCTVRQSTLTGDGTRHQHQQTQRSRFRRFPKGEPRPICVCCARPLARPRQQKLGFKGIIFWAIWNLTLAKRPSL